MSPTSYRAAPPRIDEQQYSLNFRFYKVCGQTNCHRERQKMQGYRDRLIRAAKLEPALYEEVEIDETATGQAMLTVVISSLAAGIGGVSGGFLSIALHTAAALIGWVAWAYLTYFIGTRLMAESETKANLGELLRCTGFASAPGLLQIFGFIPVLGPLVRLASVLWMLAAFVVAVRQALDYKSTPRAIGVCLIGWLVIMSLNGILFFISLGTMAR
jgi:hypothetical protein